MAQDIFPPASIAQLSEFHDRQNFDCGDPMRNAWLRGRAVANQRSDDARTYVVADQALVRGYYALTVGSILRTGLPGALRRNAPDPVACVLLGQLAVALPYQSCGLGRELVLHAMGQAVKIADLGGCRLFAVHPATSALEGYYQRFGFTLIAATPTLMAMNMHRVRGIVAAVAGPGDVRR